MSWESLRMKDPKIVVGLISGTSADGVDAAVVRIHGAGPATRPELVHFTTVPYPEDDRRELFALFSPQTGTVDRICALNFRLGELFADAALQAIAGAGLRAPDVDLIGSHGQTIWHIPPEAGRSGSGLQIGEAAVIAARTAIPVVADFRVADLAVGGHGAPLAPYIDYLLFRDPTRSRAVQNLGGIGNVTHLRRGDALDEVLAFDTGPSNTVINALVEAATDGREEFDRDGHLAESGRVDGELLDELLRDPYFGAPPPKSTGRERYGVQYAAELIKAGRTRGLSPADLVATATRLTVETIVRSYREFLDPRGGVDEVILGGGGSRNPVLRGWLAEALAPVPVRTHEEFGINGKAKEAMLFAILANDAVAGHPWSLTSATGSTRPAVLGKLVPA
ncbi:MAG TPA: anhydro-N-acetylmuramic acid kinase [bacterium]|nr:anhydro-N-acetylmuramic acid kinase [bacterium]